MATAVLKRTQGVAGTSGKVSSITHTQSVTLVKNLFRASFSSIAYIRNLFDEDCFQDGVVGGTRYKKLVGNKDKKDVELFIRWLEKGVFDALTKKYLSTVFLEIYEKFDSGAGNGRNPVRDGTQRADSGVGNQSEENTTRRLLELFSFEVSYPKDSNSPEFSMSRAKPSGLGNRNDECSRENIKQSTAAVLRRLVEMASTLGPLPEHRVISMKLLYTDETPQSYEPPLFCAAADDSTNCWFENRPLRLSPGKVRTPYHELLMHIRTQTEVTDPNHTMDRAPYGGADGEEGETEQEGKDEEELPDGSDTEDESDVMNILASQTQKLDVGDENTARQPLSGDVLQGEFHLSQKHDNRRREDERDEKSLESPMTSKPKKYEQKIQADKVGKPRQTVGRKRPPLQEKFIPQTPSVPSFIENPGRRKVTESEAPIQQRPRKRRAVPRRLRNTENVSSCI